MVPPYTSAQTGYEPELLTYVDGLVTPLSNSQLILLNNLISDIKSGLNISNLSDAFDTLYIYAGETQESSLKNLAKNSHHGTGASIPNWTQYQGFQGASGKYIDLNYNPSTQGINYTSTNASIFYYGRLNVQDDCTCGGQDSGATMKSFIIGRNSSNQFWAVVNTAGYANCMTNYDGTGFYIACREDSNTINGYRNGVKQTTKYEAATSIYNVAHYGCAIRIGTNTYNAQQELSILGYGRSFNQSEVTAIKNAFEAYMDAHGKGVI